MARQVPDNQFAWDPFTNASPVRPNVPRLNYQVGPTEGAAIPVLGIVALAAVVLLFEHFRRKGGRK